MICFFDNIIKILKYIKNINILENSSYFWLLNLLSKTNIIPILQYSKTFLYLFNSDTSVLYKNI